MCGVRLFWAHVGATDFWKLPHEMEINKGPLEDYSPRQFGGGYLVCLWFVWQRLRSTWTP